MNSSVYFCLLAVIVTVNAQFQWTPIIKLSTNEVNTWQGENDGQSIVASGNSVHVAWTDYSSGSGIYYIRSDDQGMTWGTEVRLSPTPGNDSFALLAVSGSIVHLSFYRNLSESWYIRSLDNGDNWETPVFLNDTSFWPSVFSVGQYVYISLNTAVDVGNTEVFFLSSSDNGTTWGPLVRISNATGRSEDPCIAAEGSNIYIVWNDNRIADTIQMYYRRSTDYGVTWGLETALTANPLSTYSPYVATNGNFVDAAFGYHNTANLMDTYIMRSSDFGATFGSLQDISNSPNISDSYPSVVRSGSDVFYLSPVFLKALNYFYSNDSGVSWQGPYSLWDNATQIYGAYLFMTDGIFHVTWSDSHLGHGAVYYTRTTYVNFGSSGSFTTGTSSSTSAVGTTSSSTSASGQGTSLAFSSTSNQGTSYSSASGQGTSSSTSSSSSASSSAATGTGATSSNDERSNNTAVTEEPRTWYLILTSVVLWNIIQY